MGFTIDPHYQDWNGVDLRSNAVTRSENMPQRMQNTVYTNDGELDKRRGCKVVSVNAPDSGTYVYQRKDPDTGELVSETIGVDSDGKLKRRKTSTLTVNYAGAATTATASMQYSTSGSQFVFTVTIDGTPFSYNLGVGFDAASVMTMLQLQTALNLIFGITVSISGSTSVEAALLELEDEHDLLEEDLTLNAYYWEDVPSAESAPFFTAIAEKDNANFENASFTTNSQSAYVTDGGWVYKYDGVACCKAGLPGAPKFQSNPSSSNAGGSLTASAVYKYLIEHEYMDANGVIQRSPASIGSSNDVKTVTLGGTHNTVSFNYYNLLPSTGYGAWGAYVNGAGQQKLSAGSFTITVDNGSAGAHNIPVNSWVLLNNSTSGDLEKYQVTATTSTSITITHPGNTDYTTLPLTLADNSYIHCSCGEPLAATFAGTFQWVDAGLTTKIYRTKANGSVFYECDMAFNNAYTANTSFTDQLADSSLGNEYVPQTYTYDAPRACKYLATWNTQLVQAGRPYESTLSTIFSQTLPNSATKFDEAYVCAENAFYWADIESPEGFPREGLHEDEVFTNKGDGVSGLAQNKDSFFVFKDRSTALFTGDIGDNNIRREILEVDRGCAAHASIKQVNGRLVFLDPIYGFQSVIAGQLPQSIGLPIDTLVRDNARSGVTRLNLKRAVAGVNDLDDQYICFIPAESLQSTTRHANTNSVVAVLDYKEITSGVPRNAWHIWTGLNMQGGILYDDETLFWVEKAYSSYSSAIRSNLFKQSRLGSTSDYEDHNQAISFDWISAWIFKGQPSVDKLFVSLLLKSVQGGDFTLTLSQYGNFIIDSSIMSTTTAFTSTGFDVKRNKIVTLSSRRLESTAIRLQNSQHKTNCPITGWELSISNEYDQELHQ